MDGSSDRSGANSLERDPNVDLTRFITTAFTDSCPVKAATSGIGGGSKFKGHSSVGILLTIVNSQASCWVACLDSLCRLLIPMALCLRQRI